MVNIDLKTLEKSTLTGIPPVHTWTPSFCGDMDLIIQSNGDWVHEGSPMKRASMVKMFSHILWYEDGEYFLMTPVEKVRIQVEDAPFLVTKWEWVTTEQGKTMQLTTTTDDVMLLGQNCDMWIASYKTEERPYISMRYGMKALIARHVFYQLAEQLVEIPHAHGLGLVSAGQSYLLENISG